MSLALSNQISILAADGTEQGRIEISPDDDIPFDNPAGIAFDSRTKSLLVDNHALSGITDHFAVLQVFVRDPGDPLEKPNIP